MLGWFYPTSQPYNYPNKAITTNFRINNIDISNNYTGIGTNSNIKVSQLYTINYYSNGQSIGNLFELNLPVFSGTINVNYKIWPPSNNNGLLIQILQSTTLSFNYNVDCSFVMVGGGGGGGSSNQSNAGGGGGAGELITGNIINYQSKYSSLSITIGNGGASGTSGGDTTITYTTTSTNPPSSVTITANGGGGGGNGKTNSSNTTGSSSGGSGSYSNTTTHPGTVTSRNPLSNIGVFNSMISYGNQGSQGNYQINDSGAGGGGGGAGAASADPGNENPGVGGNGLTMYFGNTSVDLAGGGGGGARSGTSTSGGLGGIGGGGSGGDNSSGGNGYGGFTNCGAGGGGAWNSSGTGGVGGSGTVFIYILPSGVSI